MTLPSPSEDTSECHCSLCYKLGALWAYYPRDQVAVTTSSHAPPYFHHNNLSRFPSLRTQTYRHNHYNKRDQHGCR
ncbi:hypothetical protein F4801DRAFT_545173 [Xylaria longipes]|nr:hypothetical protein F4801DRAFT_545173 [Xylaria longipes]